MRIREPVVAGQFYESDPNACRRQVESLFAGVTAGIAAAEVPLGGLVPHAGWIYSGSVAAAVFKTLQKRRPAVFVLFGGVHRYRGKEAALFGDGRWDTPLGPLLVDGRLAERVLGQTNLIVDDPYAHEWEHSLEVQAPFIAYAWKDVKILPISVPAGPTAYEVGDAVARTLIAYDYDALVVGTTDLTHYGPNYGFVPRGVGKEANRWAHDQNDRRFIDLVVNMQGDRVVAEALKSKNACSSGAVAATMAAAKKLGAARGILLEHTSSSEILARRSAIDAEDSVGYAGIVFV